MSTTLDVPKTSGPRRSHRKSRNGCPECKRRKVKCDEKSPCTNCIKHGIACSFPSAGGPAAATRPPPPPPAPAASRQSAPSIASNPSSALSPLAESSTTPSEREGSYQLNHFRILTDATHNFHQPGSGPVWARDLELMHQWSTSTYATFSVRPMRQEIWRDVVPNEAYACEFLMHGLLAVSALHIASLKPESSSVYIDIATSHQTIGLASFRTELSNITDQNCNSLFAFSSIVVAYACTRPIRNGNNTLPEPIDNAIELFLLSRGVAEVLKPCSERVKNGALSPLLLTGYFEATVPPDGSSQDTLLELEKLKALIQQEITDPKQTAIYEAALMLLEKSYIQVITEEKPCEASVGLLWPNVVPFDFITFLQSRQPCALVLLAYYCVLLQQVDSYWYLKGWGSQLIEALGRSIPPSLHTWIEWPVRYVKLYPTL